MAQSPLSAFQVNSFSQPPDASSQHVSPETAASGTPQAFLDGNSGWAKGGGQKQAANGSLRTRFGAERDSRLGQGFAFAKEPRGAFFR